MATSAATKETLQSIREVGLAGINNLIDEQNIADNELADALNIVFDNGAISPRLGSELVLVAPAGETGTSTQIMVMPTSDGTDFIIGVWGLNFYLYDSTNSQWIKINGSVVPTIQGAGIFYGNLPWNNGKNDDRLYFCNGADSFIKWQASIGYVGTTTASGDSVITVGDATRFPTAGGYSVIIQNGNTQIIKAVTSANATSITLTGTVGAVVPAGSAITIQCVTVASMSKGNILAKYYRRLFVFSGKGTESSGFFSKIDLPEDFGTTADVSTGGSIVITQGDGGITDAQGFGQYLLIAKRNAHFSFSFEIDSTLGAQIDQLVPLVYGETMGPFKSYLGVTAENNYYYPTVSEGIFKLSPNQTGSSATVGAVSAGDRVINTITAPGFTFIPGRVAVHNRKIFWLGSTLSTPTTNNATLTNDIVIVYDMRFDAWTIFDNWNATDIKSANGNLYFINKTDGGLYLALQDYYQDFAKSTTTASYNTVALTKRFDFGLPAQVKTFKNALYVQGYIDQTTTLYVDVLYNELGGLGKQTFKIVGANTDYVAFAPSISFGDSELGINPLGGVPSLSASQNGNPFRVYLDVSHSLAFYNVQLRFYTNAIGSNWAVTFVAFDPLLEGVLPAELIISPGI